MVRTFFLQKLCYSAVESQCEIQENKVKFNYHSYIRRRSYLYCYLKRLIDIDCDTR